MLLSGFSKKGSKLHLWTSYCSLLGLKRELCNILSSSLKFDNFDYTANCVSRTQTLMSFCLCLCLLNTTDCNTEAQMTSKKLELVTWTRTCELIWLDLPGGKRKK